MNHANPQIDPDRPTRSRGPAAWQAELARGYRDPAANCWRPWTSRPRPAARRGLRTQPFPLRVPRGFARRMEPGNPRDPLLMQVLPANRRDDSQRQAMAADPVGDLARASGRPACCRNTRGAPC